MSDQETGSPQSGSDLRNLERDVVEAIFDIDLRDRQETIEEVSDAMHEMRSCLTDVLQVLSKAPHVGDSWRGVCQCLAICEELIMVCDEFV